MEKTPVKSGPFFEPTHIIQQSPRTFHYPWGFLFFVYYLLFMEQRSNIIN